jgi:NAD(P)-dependent dehydrogenase (short-subunit alcohol dehydrogenase family)
MSKVWFVTGASRGIGAQIAIAVLDAGDNLVATARRKESLDNLPQSELLLRLSLDVTLEEQSRIAVAEAVQKFGRIDVLVNNAGYGLLGAVEETSAQEARAIYDTNVFGLLNVTNSVLPIMRKQRCGHIINMSSLGGYQASPGWGVYGSTKFAVEGITEALYAELRPLGIHATVIEPGFFRTDFMDTSSLKHTCARIGDYESTVGKTRSFADENNHLQPGDPAKLAGALIKLAALPDPPVRLQLGSDAVRRVKEKNTFVSAEIDRWRSLSASTDSPVSVQVRSVEEISE